MGNLIPGKYDRNWVNIWLLSTAVFWMLWNGLRFFVLHKVPSSGGLLGILLLSMASTFIVCCSGFLDLRLLFYASLVGIVIGLCLAFVYYLQGSDWADLAGLAAYMELAAFGTLAGVIGELLSSVLKRKE